MQGARDIIRTLTAVLTSELTSVNQYFLQARMYENWGLRQLGRVTYEESIGEMKHADKLVKRILFLDGLPNLQDLHKLKIGETVGEGLQADLDVETGGRRTLVDGVKQSEHAQDNNTRQNHTENHANTEEHNDFLETQLALLGSLGEQN